MPGTETEARTPDPRTLRVTERGPSFSRLEYDLTPLSVRLKPLMSLSKLNRDRLVMRSKVSIYKNKRYIPGSFRGSGGSCLWNNPVSLIVC